MRYAGGPNAGHTLVVGAETIVVRLIPSGILRPLTRCVMAQGMVVDPAVVVGEIKALEGRGGHSHRRAGSSVVESGRTLILPYHPAHRRPARGARSAGDKIGTTKRGIGPCYEDKTARRGVRVGDLGGISITSRPWSGADAARSGRR